MNTIQDLTRLVPPPPNPVAANGDWKKVEKEIDLKLPVDYKEIVSIYGAGRMCRLISVPSPFVRPIPASEFWSEWVDLYRDLASYGVAVPYDLFPSRPGLMPCGNYADSDTINWLTKPHEDSWRTVYYSRSHGFLELGILSLVDVLVGLITGSTDLPEVIRPEAVPKEHRFFASLSELQQ